MSQWEGSIPVATWDYARPHQLHQPIVSMYSNCLQLTAVLLVNKCYELNHLFDLSMPALVTPLARAAPQHLNASELMN